MSMRRECARGIDRRPTEGPAMTAPTTTKHPIQITDGLLQLKVPIPNNPLGWVLPYLIEGRDGWTLVDSGWNVPEAADALELPLNNGGGGFGRLRPLLGTHVQPDHSGL